MVSMSEWTTRLPPEIARQFGVEELHDVCFASRGRPGKGPTVSLGIPDCELQHCLVAGGGTLVTTVHRPTGNLSVKYWIRYACKLATENNTAPLFSCDTVEQAELAAKRASKWLPKHGRMPLERTYDPATRADAPLS